MRAKKAKSKQPKPSKVVDVKQKAKSGFKQFKSFIVGMLVCGAGIDLIAYFFEGITVWALDQLLVKFTSSLIASVVTLLLRPILKYFFKTRGGKKFMNFFKKIGAFFARIGKYLKANKVTLGGIFNSVVTGAAGVTVTVLGYTYDLTDLLVQYVSELAWVKNVQINGFNLTPLILGLIAVLIAVWSAAAAVLRGWETPEQNAEVIKAKKAAKLAAKENPEPTTADQPEAAVKKLSSEELHKKKVEELTAQLINDN